MSNRWIVVTGAAGDIGRAVCQVLRRDGFFVYGLDLTLAADANDARKLDLSDAAAVLSAASDLAAKYDVVGIVHVAAVQLPAAVGRIEVSDWERAFRVNVFALDALVGALSESARQTGGAIVAIGSVHAQATSPAMVIYAATKAALESWVRSAAIELAPAITVNVIAPGAINGAKLQEGLRRWPVDEQVLRKKSLIARTPMERVGGPVEIAEAVAYFISEKSRFATGTTLRIDGGVSARLASE